MKREDILKNFRRKGDDATIIIASFDKHAL